MNDPYVACPFQIQMCDLQGGFGLATAFFYETGGDIFIITNWHNVVGKDPLTGEELNPYRSPLHLMAKWPVATREASLGEGGYSVHFEARRIELEDGSGRPLWFEHPALGSACDVVAIPFDRPAEWPSNIHRAANRIDESSIPVEAGLKAIVIGFPQGLSVGPGFPILKSGSVASHPGFDVRLGGQFAHVGGLQGGTELPAIALDVHTVPGMSGSPVFGEYAGTWHPSGAMAGDSVIGGVGRAFLGCHSQRVGELEERSGLALCFGRDAIEQTCRGKHVGQRFPRQDIGYDYVK